MQCVLACSCLPLSVNETMQREHIGLVVRGTVLRAFVPTLSHDPAVNATNGAATGVTLFSGDESNQYIVQITKVYKGCNVKTNERIIVSSSSVGSMCGMSLTVNTNYIFSTSVQNQPIDPVTSAQLGNRSKVKQSIWISSCGLNQVWSTVAAQDKATIQSYKKQCLSV
jgi:Tissue inhibitor of metalloproteinase